jgi:hypothetical protein
MNHIKRIFYKKNRASAKAVESWMGDHDHPSIISQQGANSTVDVTLNPRQTHPSHYS